MSDNQDIKLKQQHAEYVQGILDTLGISMRTLAKKAGMAHGTVARIVDTETPTLTKDSTLKKIGDATGFYFQKDNNPNIFNDPIAVNAAALFLDFWKEEELNLSSTDAVLLLDQIQKFSTKPEYADKPEKIADILKGMALAKTQ